MAPARDSKPAGDGVRNRNPRNRMRSGFLSGPDRNQSGPLAGPEPERAGAGRKETGSGGGRNRNGADGPTETRSRRGLGKGPPFLPSLPSFLPSGFPNSPPPALYIVYGFSGPEFPFLSRSFFYIFLTRFLHPHHWLSGTYVLSVVC